MASPQAWPENSCERAEAKRRKASGSYRWISVRHMRAGNVSSRPEMAAYRPWSAE